MKAAQRGTKPVEQLSSFIPNATAFGFMRECWTGMLLPWEAGPWNDVSSSKELLLSSLEFAAGALGLCHLLLVASSSTALFTTINSSQQWGQALLRFPVLTQEV